MFVAYTRDKVYKDVGTTRQLFIDDDVVAVVKNITRRQHSPQKHPANPLIKRDRPWEVVPYFRTSTFNVIWDQSAGLYRTWYDDFFEYFGMKKGQDIRERRFYAFSRDGLRWEKPALGKYSIDGHDTNAIHVSKDEMWRCPSIILDPQESDPARRYKMVCIHAMPGATIGYAPRGQHKGGLSLAFSKDGIDWTFYANNPVVPIWKGDVEILTFDPMERKYVLYGRYGGRPHGNHPSADEWFAPVYPSKPEGVWGVRRRIYRLESEDCVNWSEAELVFDPGAEDNIDDGHYGFVPWRADEMHLGLLTVLHQVDNTLDLYLLHSRDGRDWKRMLHHRPFIPRGGPGSYDEFDVETPTQPLVVGDELWFYYGGNSVHHDWWIYGQGQGLDVPEVRDKRLAQDGHHLCLATMRLDGYVSLDATVREGWIETKPIFSAAPHLFINGKCAPGGYIRVEVMDAWNNVWETYSKGECQAFEGDSVRHRVGWAKGDEVSAIPGAIKLKFYLRNAELYGFHFGDG